MDPFTGFFYSYDITVVLWDDITMVLCRQVSSTDVPPPRAVCQLANWPKPLDFAAGVCNDSIMEKDITIPQVKALDAILTFQGNFDQQCAALYVIWPGFTRRQNNLDRLQKRGLIEWIPANTSAFGERWFCTEMGTRAVIEHGKKAGVL